MPTETIDERVENLENQVEEINKNIKKLMQWIEKPQEIGNNNFCPTHVCSQCIACGCLCPGLDGRAG